MPMMSNYSGCKLMSVIQFLNVFTKVRVPHTLHNNSLDEGEWYFEKWHGEHEMVRYIIVRCHLLLATNQGCQKHI